MRYLGIDFGTSFLKGAVLDLDRLTVGSIRRVPCPPPLSGLPPMRTEFDPEGFVAAARQLIEEPFSSPNLLLLMKRLTSPRLPSPETRQ